MPPVRLMLPEPALPIRFYECRPFNIKKGSNDVLMQGLIKTLKNNYKGETQKNVEWYDKLQFVINEEEFSAELFLFKGDYILEYATQKMTLVSVCDKSKFVRVRHRQNSRNNLRNYLL